MLRVIACLVLSCLVLSCLVLSCLVLSCLVLSCLVLSCLVLSCLVLSCLVLSCLVGVLANTPVGVKLVAHVICQLHFHAETNADNPHRRGRDWESRCLCTEATPGPTRRFPDMSTERYRRDKPEGRPLHAGNDYFSDFSRSASNNDTVDELARKLSEFEDTIAKVERKQTSTTKKTAPTLQSALLLLPVYRLASTC